MPDLPIPKATHEGEVVLGPDITLPCAVLEDGTRLLTQNEFVRALGRTGNVAKTSVLDPDLNFYIPSFLQADNLKPFISNDLGSSSSPVIFRPAKGRRAVGYRAELLPEVCNVYIEAEAAGKLVPSQRHIAQRSRLLMRGYATVGIIALVDEATGYQAVRSRDALEKILEKYLRDHKLKWAKTFPDEFYTELFRLRGWSFSELGFQFRTPQAGKDTNDIVYERLAPGVLEALQKRNPRNARGRRKAKHFQWLTVDHGIPELKSHISGVIALMRASSNWRRFKSLLNRAYPKVGDTLELPFDEEE